MLIQAAERDYRTWIFDSRRWQHYRPRADDIIIASYPKCGVTWMQRIVGLLMFQTSQPMPIMQISAWIDRRFPQTIEAAMAQIEAQTHRRFLKSHIPLDGMPFYDEVKYIHVARDGRDACMSFHNHATGFTDLMLHILDKAGLDDETVARPIRARFPIRLSTSTTGSRKARCRATRTALRACPFFSLSEAGGPLVAMPTCCSSTTTI